MLRLLPLLLLVWVSGCQLETFPAPNTDGNSGSSPSSETPDPNDPNPPTTPIGETGDVVLYWSPPLERVNGDIMLSTEIGGYEIRYKHETDSFYQSIVLDAGFIPPYAFQDLANPDDMIFEVAVFDTDGIYSDFVRAQPN